MSVLIKGIQMPKSCDECQLTTQYYDGGMDVCCPLDKYVLPLGRKHDDCPLVEVPPHGRLIDADALAHDLDYDVENDQRILDEMDFVGKERERVQFDKDCKQNCLWYLSDAPTIIPTSEEGE